MYTLSTSVSEYAHFFLLRLRLINREQWLKELESEAYSPLAVDSCNSTFFVRKYNSSFNKAQSSSPSYTPKLPSYPSKPPHSALSNISSTHPGFIFKKEEINPNITVSYGEIPCQIRNKKGHFSNRCKFKYAPSINRNPPMQKACDGFEMASPAYNPRSHAETMLYQSGLGESSTNNFGHWSCNNQVPIWIPDSGDTSHVTNNTALMTDTEEFTGDEQVMVGDVWMDVGWQHS
ncbi:uncharacterized protein LOC113285504 isoform X2 [Papaver somniferum]|uniref:uncharacterized protein LOC113285504 isoform X2 n=1 Tax=Papaver somniferum TaxID=3469 RepID=UPI000E6F94C1|nr:uncharacterized protein LOC113285504 isoform X2 [Papaver somniferum]